jgi:hypothetical protein
MNNERTIHAKKLNKNTGAYDGVQLRSMFVSENVQPPGHLNS